MDHRSADPAAHRPKLTGRSLVRPRHPVDPERIRLSREAELRSLIAKSHELQAWIDEFGEGMQERQWALRRHHLASSVRITPRISPKLSRRFDCVRQILGNQFKAELYVVRSPEIEADCCAMPDGSLLVTMTSGAVEKFSPSEQLFVMGHEVGHFLLGHHEWPVGAILAPQEHSDSPASPRLALQLLSWSRCCEISADRFGLLCAQSEDAMARAFLKLACGLPAGLLGSSEDYLLQLDEWIEHRLDEEGWSATHPLHGIRIRAGQTFWQSDYVDEIFGPCADSTAGFSAADADALAVEQLATMDPDPAALESTDHGDLVREVLAYAGVVVVASDGEMDPRELPALVSIADPKHVARAMKIVSDRGIEELLEETGRRMANFVKLAPDEIHHRVLIQLMVLAYVDGHLANEEVEIIRCIAEPLGFGAIGVDMIISQLENGVWSE